MDSLAARQAFSESGWAGIVSGNLRLVRVDRLFRAGLEPLQPGNEALWIIDYKTSPCRNLDPSSALPTFRATFRAAVANVRRRIAQPALASHDSFAPGFTIPRMSLFDWWEI